ncbi:MAG TPA: carboxypeptidase-like regulatory domain-containing protein, partial [Chroococcales cyanobacterium]
TSCNVSLRLGSMISVELRTASGADPGPGEIIALGIEPAAYSSSTYSSQSGQYALSLPRGRFHLGFSGGMRDTAMSATGNNSSNLNSGCRTFIMTSVKVLDVLSDGAQTLKIPDLVKLKGTVTDVFGQAVPAARVTILPSAKSNNQLLKELGIKTSLITDQQGNFEVDAEPGLYDINICPDPGSRLCELNEQAFAIKTSSDRKFQLAEGHRLRGQVYANDQPLPDSVVHVIGIERKINAYTKTDEQGRFSIGVPAGNYKLVVLSRASDRLRSIANNSGRHNLAPWTRDIVVGGDTHVAVKLQNGSLLQGVLLDSADKPRANVPLHICSDSGSHLQRLDIEWAIASTITDARGNFSFVLVPGSYWLCPYNDTANAERIDFESNSAKLEINWFEWCQLQFEVLGENGQKIPRCHISFAPYGTGEIEVSNGHDDANFALSTLDRPGVGEVVTDDDGIGTILVPSGVYAIKFKPPPDGSFDSKTIRQLSVIGDLSKTIRLPLLNDSRKL